MQKVGDLDRKHNANNEYPALYSEIDRYKDLNHPILYALTEINDRDICFHRVSTCLLLFFTHAQEN
jgi:hypothetical protein